MLKIKSKTRTETKRKLWRVKMRQRKSDGTQIGRRVCVAGGCRLLSGSSLDGWGVCCISRGDGSGRGLGRREQNHCRHIRMEASSKTGEKNTKGRLAEPKSHVSIRAISFQLTVDLILGPLMENPAVFATFEDPKRSLKASSSERYSNLQLGRFAEMPPGGRS